MMAQTCFIKLPLSKFLTGVLPVTALVSGAFAPLMSRAAGTPPICQIKEVGHSETSSRTDLTIGSRRVTILGWTHLSPSEADRKTVTHLLLSAAAASKKHDCDAAASNLKELLSKQAPQVSLGANLLEELKNVTTDFNPNVLGVEYSPQDWPLNRKNEETLAGIMDFIVEHCSNETKSLAANLESAFPGPQYVFAKSRVAALRIEPLEDATVVEKAHEIARQFDALTATPLRTEDFKPAARPLFEAFLRHYHQGDSLSQQQIDEILTKEGSDATQARAAKALPLIKALTDLNPQRTKSMADKILMTDGDYIVAVGNVHARDLARQLFERCKQADAVHPSPRDSTTPPRTASVSVK